jgi:flagellar hook assembly protein FlgD
MRIHGTQTSGPFFSPNGDGVQDAFTATATLSLPADWTLALNDAVGGAVRTFTGAGATSVNQAWDGKDNSGTDVPEGTYAYVLAAVEPGSGVGANTVTGQVTLDRTPPTAVITAPSPGATTFDTIPITGTATDDANFERFIVDYGMGSAPTSWTVIRQYPAPIVAGTLATWTTNSFMDEVLVPGGNGDYTIRLTVSDRAGNEAAEQVLVHLDNMLVHGVSRDPVTIRPASGESSAITFTTNQESQLTVRILPETATLGVFPDPTPESGALRTLSLGSVPAGSHVAVWDGRNDGGSLVPEDAYVYTIEAHAPSGRFGKFNRYIQLLSSAPSMWVGLGGYSMPPEATAFNPYKNDFFSYSFSLLNNNVGRGELRIRYRFGTGPWQTLVREEGGLVFPGSNSVFWDGRDNSGQILTGYSAIDYYLVGRTNPFAEHFLGLKSNHVVVTGNEPRLPGVSLKADPYLMNLSYGQVARLGYSLEDTADVTVSVQDPTGATVALLVNAEERQPGDHEVVWDGVLPDGRLPFLPGHYTFSVTATDALSGESVTRRGNIVVFK